MLNLSKRFIIGLSLLILFVVSVFCYANTGQIYTPDCPKEKGYTQVIVDKVIKQATCYNPQTGLSFQEKSNSLKGDLFYNQGKYCGLGCDLDGKNCTQGVCNILDCPREKGYTEIKYNNAHGICYNPTTKLSYDKEKFYNQDKYCGSGCDLDGKNCTQGFCNIFECAKEKGYTELLDGKLCYNPKTGFAYQNAVDEKTKKSGYHFYYKDMGISCGAWCDINGKNCLSTYPNGYAKATFFDLIPQGYTDVITVEAPDSLSGKRTEKALSNPKTKLASDSSGDFYYQGAWCGKNCDSNGRNCANGVCNVQDCPNGYTTFKFVDKLHPVGGFCISIGPICSVKIKHAVCSK